MGKIIWKKTIKDVLLDLQLVSSSTPNERLPKEEQIRTRLFCSLAGNYKYANIERGYQSIDEGNSSECDIWLKSKIGIETWIEIKRCWSGRGFTDKPKEQLESWQKDISKLASIPNNTQRIFILVGVFENNPILEKASTKVIHNISTFFDNKVIETQYEHFNWRKSSIQYVACWVYKWNIGDAIIT